MANQTARYTSIDRAIKDYLGEGELTTAKYLRLYQIAFRGLEELNMDVTGTPKTRKLPVGGNKTVELPGDYLQWSKIGVLNANGEVATLRHNPGLTSYGLGEDDRTSMNTDGGTNASYRNYQEGDCYYNLFGIPGGTQNLGEFTVNDVEGVILLSNSFSYEYIILEYLSSPIDDPDFLFPIQARECLIAWLAWKDIALLPSGRRSNLGMIAERKREYYRLKGLAKRRLNPLRISEINDTIRLNSRISIKA